MYLEKYIYHVNFRSPSPRGATRKLGIKCAFLLTQAVEIHPGLSEIPGNDIVHSYWCRIKLNSEVLQLLDAFIERWSTLSKSAGTGIFDNPGWIITSLIFMILSALTINLRTSRHIWSKFSYYLTSNVSRLKIIYWWGYCNLSIVIFVQDTNSELRRNLQDFERGINDINSNVGNLRSEFYQISNHTQR